MTRLQQSLGRFGPLLLLAGARPRRGGLHAVRPAGGGGGSGSPAFSQAPLTPVQLGGSWNPLDLLAWLFNPIFQILFILLTVFDTSHAATWSSRSSC